MGIVSPSDSLGIANNIALPAKYINYKLVISKPSYATYQQTFTKTQLKQYYISKQRTTDRRPFQFIQYTAERLVAYYPLNGDVLDHSGNNNNGTAYGTLTPTADHNGNAAAAYYFNGMNSYIEVPDAPSLNPASAITMSAWYNPVSFVGSGNEPIIDKPYTSITPPYYQYHLGVCGNDYTNNHSTFGINLSLNNNYVGTGTPAFFIKRAHGITSLVRMMVPI